MVLSCSSGMNNHRQPSSNRRPGAARPDLRPRKSLGQHFLVDAGTARRIASELAPQPGDCIVEIGPGRGALTRFLAVPGVTVLAVDIDARMLAEAGKLAQEEGWAERVRFLHADALRLDLTAIAAEQGRALRVAGNLPYNITSPLLFHIIDHRRAVGDCVFMMQREVAQRLVSPPGSREYGIPSVIAQLHADLRLAFHVPPEVFHPKPKVWSSVIGMRFRFDREERVSDYAQFRRLVRMAFGQRRKMLSNSLRPMLAGRDLPDEIAARLHDRPEQLSVDDCIALCNALSASSSNAV
jgi:16S rRNA (adenine1518-N6/adenine1519-N6)-dimethyltransferase